MHQKRSNTPNRDTQVHVPPMKYQQAGRLTTKPKAIGFCWRNVHILHYIFCITARQGGKRMHQRRSAQIVRDDRLCITFRHHIPHLKWGPQSCSYLRNILVTVTHLSGCSCSNTELHPGFQHKNSSPIGRVANLCTKSYRPR